MNWLLLILKILGIFIAVIFGILLSVLLLLLFAPFRYRAKVQYGSEPLKVSAGISWLLFVLRVRILYAGQKPVIAAKVFGIPVYRSDKEKKPKKKKKEKPKRQPKKKKAITAPAAQEAPIRQGQPQKLPEKEILSGDGQPETKCGELPETEQKQGFFSKIADKIQKLRETIHKITEKLKQLLHRAEAVKEIFSKEENKQAISFAWAQLKHLLRHILPRKISGTLVYGSGDPCSTGQALGILAVLYARYGELLSVQPDFEEKRFECDVDVRGRVQVFALLCLTIKVIKNQQLKQMIHDFKNIKTIE